MGSDDGQVKVILMEGTTTKDFLELGLFVGVKTW